MQILSTLIGADAGEARVAGHDVASEPDAVREAIGVTGQFSAVDGLLTGEENLALMADLRHLDRAEGRRLIAELLERFELVEAAGKRRRHLLRWDASPAGPGDDPGRRPRIIFLDEPTTGLDPRSRRTLWQIIRDLVADGVTIFLTTHYLEEADRARRPGRGARSRAGSSPRARRTSSSGTSPAATCACSSPIVAPLESAAACPGRVRSATTTRSPFRCRATATSLAAGLLDGLDRRVDRGREPDGPYADLDDVFLALTGHARHGAQEEPLR